MSSQNSAYSIVIVDQDVAASSNLIVPVCHMDMADVVIATMPVNSFNNQRPQLLNLIAPCLDKLKSDYKGSSLTILVSLKLHHYQKTSKLDMKN